MGIGSFVGGLASGATNMIDSFLHPEKGYQAAGEEYQKAFNTGLGYQAPYAQYGQQQIPNLYAAENALMNPAAVENSWINSYTTSPYAQQLLKENQAAGLDAASQQGLLGSSAALSNIQQGAGNIVQKDRQAFLDDLMQKYMEAIGIGANIYGAGATTAGNIGNQASKFGEQMGEAKFGEYNAPGQQLNNLIRSGAQYFGNKSIPMGGA